MRALLAAVVAALVVVPCAAGDVQKGQRLFDETCAACHGPNGEGVANQGPSLHGAGAAAADFYLSTGRMPLDHPTEPVRSDPAYSDEEIRDLVDYVATFGGPPIPHVDPGSGDLSAGQRLFTQYCAGCHQIMARGGTVTGAVAPALDDSTPTQIAEAVRVGPYVMATFSEREIDERELNSIIRYVQYTRHPDNRGGWSLLSLGPVPEGLVAWLVGALALVLFIRLLGKRMED